MDVHRAGRRIASDYVIHITLAAVMLNAAPNAEGPRAVLKRHQELQAALQEYTSIGF